MERKCKEEFCNGEEEQYPPPKRSITPDESTLAGEAVGRGDGAANASTAVSMTVFSISKSGTMSANYFISRLPQEVFSNII